MDRYHRRYELYYRKRYELEATVKVFKEKMPGTSIMVGGAVVTQEYAKTIGADSYSKDGIDAIHKADEIMKNRS